MSETFYGEWSLEVVEKTADFDQRFKITVSNNSDSIYPGTPGISISVSGEQWEVTMEWNDNVGSGWQTSDVQRSASYTADEGLVIKLGADDKTTDPNRDYDYDDLVLVCKYLERTINPQPASGNPYPYDFTTGKPDEG